eukprot:TRINITY_DN65974_c0_g1_i1.p2 TRINITY_DN65974_c0_g1~~TRINITY_DN65974_c0_g1_i1.p2  ORF type:complete len:336 (+),score=149.37 TRINITY_DN65974_c0_g1_i1:80-1087(+)
MVALLAAAAAVSLASVPSDMRAVRVKGILGCGPPYSCIGVKTISTPKPKQGEVLIRVNASSVNPVDVDLVKLGGLEGTLGGDLSGTVVECPGCTRLKAGDEVWADIDGAKLGGAYADYAIATEKQTGLKPASLDFVSAGTMPLVGLTSLECLKKTGAPWTQKNLTVVVTSGSGGTGFIGIQLAKAYGAATVVSSTSGADNIAFVKAMGADIVTDYKKEDIFDALADDSVDIVYDNYGAKGTADKAMAKIRSGGTYLLLPGGGGGKISDHPKAGVKQINFGLTDSSDHAQLDELKALFDQGKLRAHVQHRYSFDQVPAAFTFSASGQVVGKIAITA